jgi:F-type H+-transporting ATPase subunit beta
MTDKGPTHGTVLAIRGPVVDVGFPGGVLPAIDDALVIERESGPSVLVEVHAHIDEHTVRGIAMQSTAGLSRGTGVRATGGPITVPVGDAVLGRLLDVLGHPCDHGKPAHRS